MHSHHGLVRYTHRLWTSLMSPKSAFQSIPSIILNSGDWRQSWHLFAWSRLIRFQPWICAVFAVGDLRLYNIFVLPQVGGTFRFSASYRLHLLNQPNRFTFSLLFSLLLGLAAFLSVVSDHIYNEFHDIALLWCLENGMCFMFLTKGSYGFRE